MMSTLRVSARYCAKSVLRPLVYRHPPIGLQPQRLHVWTDALIRTVDVPGAVLEIGCAAGGTAAWSDRLLREIGALKRYICIDTFGGFVPEQFAADEARGTPKRYRHTFAANSPSLVRRTVTGLGSPDIELIVGDIAKLSPDYLPSKVSACLIDVDLADPVAAALDRVYPLLAPGGTIVVDDCEGRSEGWRARDAYRGFVGSRDLPEVYRFGMGLIDKELDTRERESSERLLRILNGT
ncbi:class I SAM-dependent methyltransferase [Streptomyces mirabilis]|uniref:class I SAM-dependent methyltransferase n=1 Tax=Streptomyces mirabilis TaxID=68239 RepID=UPI0033C49670